jgi:AGZA family xanthine/uracil permease-like MFS transporter
VATRPRTSRSALPTLNLDLLIDGLTDISPLLATAIPLGIYNFTEAMSNVESAAAAGDNYNLRSVLLADGTGAIVGSALGSPVPARGLHRPPRAGRPPAAASATRWRPAS